tara:strand:+ start:10769 stop:12001 length:1233 start_codon:yes stop_codon:yes gene_type:complete
MNIELSFEQAPSPARDIPVLTTAELEADPHKAFRRLRTAHSLAEHEAGGYFVLRHADVMRLGQDRRLQATETAIPRQRGLTEGTLFDIFQDGMLTSNGAVHGSRRAPMSRALAGRLIERVRTHARDASEALIASFQRAGQAEFVDQFAARLPVYTLARMLAVPEKDHPSFARHVLQMSRFFSPSFTDGDLQACTAAAESLYAYLEEMLHERRQRPRDDVLSDLLTAAADEGMLSEREVVAQVVQLIVGGTESVRAAIVAQTYLLLLNRNQWKAVCDFPELVPAAVTEAMRFEPGIAGVVRVAVEAIDLDEVTIPAASLVVLSTMSAMRDEHVYAQPDVFDIHREQASGLHSVFGVGAHRCVADALARAELEECLQVLTRRLPQLRLEEIPVLKGYMFTRDPTSMCVSWPT